MSVETSNAPRELWTVIDPTMLHEGYANADGMLPTGVLGTLRVESHARVSAQDRDEAFNRQRPDRKHLVTGYVRRDLVVPTVNEREAAVKAVYSDLYAWMPSDETHRIATAVERAIDALLLSRIEGGNDERG